MSEKREPTRAELVRMRRAQEHTERLQRASKVVARSPLTQVTARPKKKAKPVRKPGQGAGRLFRIALPMPRTDVRSISIPRPNFGWRLLSFFLVAILGTVLYLAFSRPELRVTEAVLAGNQLITQAEMNSVLNISGEPVFMLTPSELEKRLLLNYPELVSVRVSVALPNLVSVNVTERQPVIRWEQGGSYTWISEDGIAFRPRGELIGLIPVVALSAPPVEGIDSDPSVPAPFISPEMVLALKGLRGHVPPGTPILFEKGNGFGWSDPRGWKVYFGTKASDVELKMRVYEAMVSSLIQKGIRPVLINVMYPTAPYYRMNQ